MSENAVSAGEGAKRDLPPDLVIDFDFMRPGPEGSDPLIEISRLIGRPPVVWTPRYGGHWVVTDGRIIPEVLGDYERFSSREVFIGMPPGRPRAVPLEYDPPQHTEFRKLLQPAFTPQAIKRWAEEARVLAVELTEEIAPKGRCEFVADFAKHVPMIIILRMLDLPLEHRETLIYWVSTGIRSVDQQERASVRDKLNAYIEDIVDRRTANPGDDVLSKAIHTDMENGRKVTRDEAIGLASSLIGGGLDTVATTMTWMAWYLAQNPKQRKTLVDEPQRIPLATAEFLRRFGVSNITRIVAKDMEFYGAPLKAGDAILMPSAVRGLDARVFDDPLTVNFDRRNAHDHTTLSHGPHRCIGIVLAQQELRLFLEEWLARIPDFELVDGDPPVMAPGIVPSIDRLMLQWQA